METLSGQQTTTGFERSVSAFGITRMMARASFLLAAVSLISLASLHLLSPEFNPSWRMVSEYALGDHQWALTIMFLGFAASCAALFFAIRPSLRTTGGKVGLGCLLATTFGLAMGGLFDVEHPLHGLAFMVGVPSSAIAALLISVSLIRSQGPSERRVLWTAHLIWISIVLLFANLAPVMASGAQPGPGMWFGWMNRLYFLAVAGWLMLSAWRASRLTG